MTIERIEHWAIGVHFSRDVAALLMWRWAVVFWKPDYLR